MYAWVTKWSRRRAAGEIPGRTPVAQPFTHLGVPHAEQDRRVLRAFGRRSVALDQLVRLGNLRADVDTNRVTTVEDFHRKRSVL
jgi:hypothetical protein